MSIFTLVMGLFVLSLSAGAMEFRLIGKVDVATGTTFQNVEIGGLSGITYDAANGEFLCISDNRESPHYFRYQAILSAYSFEMRPVGVTYLLNKGSLDSEGIAFANDGKLFIATEGNGKSEPKIPNSIIQFDLEGLSQQSLSLPDVFRFDDANPPMRGTYANRGLESLSVTPDGKNLFTASEIGLIQDDSPSGFDKGSVARILGINLEQQTSVQYAYLVEAVEKPVGQNIKKGMSALSDVLALDETHLLTLEKSVVIVDGKTIVKNRIYSVSLSEATEISHLSTLKGAEFIPARKKLVLDLMTYFDQLSGPNGYLENFEGMTFGPVINGHRTLILVADNNFDQSQQTQFVAFEIVE